MSPAGFGGGEAECAAAGAGVCGVLAMSSFSVSCTGKRNNLDNK